MEYPKIKDVLMFGAFVTLGVTILTIVMQGKLPALFNSLPKLRAPSDDEPDAEPEPKLVPAEVLSSEDFAPGYRRYKLATSDAVDLELGQKIVLESGERSVAVAVASKRLQSTVDVVLPTSVREDQGILTETEDLVAIGEELQNGGKIKCGRATEPGLRYKGRELPVSQLIVIAGTAAAIASGCAQVAEVLEDQETSVEKATFIAYCSSAEDYGEALALLEELEAKFPQSVEVRCSWPEEEDDESTPEAKITGELLEWESNSIVVVLGPPLFTSTITNVVTTAKSYPQENVLTE